VARASFVKYELFEIAAFGHGCFGYHNKKLAAAILEGATTRSSEPAIPQVKPTIRYGLPVTPLEPSVRDACADRLAGDPKLIDDLIAGAIEVF
jgi:hypothetical protein